LLDTQKIFLIIEKILLITQKIFSSTEKIFSAIEKIFSVAKSVVFVPETVVLGIQKHVSAAKNGFFEDRNVVPIAGNLFGEALATAALLPVLVLIFRSRIPSFLSGCLRRRCGSTTDRLHAFIRGTCAWLLCYVEL
jgi:hypothetical protein